MSMQEYEQESQEKPERSEYQAGYVGSYEIEQQKIYPYGGQTQGSTLHIVAITLSSIGFFFAVAGIVGSAIVLQAAGTESFGNLTQTLQIGGVIGLLGSLFAMLAFIAIFVVAVVMLRSMALRRGYRRSSSRGKI